MLDDQRRYTEYNNLVVDYTDGDIAFFDHVRDLKPQYHLKPNTTIIAVCSSGSISLAFDNRSFIVKPNDVFFCPSNVSLEINEISRDFECKAISLSEHIIQGLLHDKISIWNQAIYLRHLSVISMSEVCREEMGHYYVLLRSKIENHKVAPHDVVQALIRALLLELCLLSVSHDPRLRIFESLAASTASCNSSLPVT